MDFDRATLEKCLIFHHQLEGKVVGVNHLKLAQWILDHVPVVCVVETKEVLTYFNGIYIPNGQEVIHKILVEALTDYEKVGGGAVYTDHIFKEVMSIIKAKSYKHIDNFDKDLDLLCLKNCMYNWRTGEHMPHDSSYLCRIQLPIAYDPKATCPNIDKMIDKVARQKDAAKCYEIIAYCLYRGYTIQKAFVLLGPGGTGKSHFLDLVTAFLGSENCSSVSIHDLLRDRFASSDLYEHSANVCGDLDQKAFDEVNTLKMATSNKDKIRAQEKGKPAFEFVNFAKLIFAANKLPATPDDSTGFYRRFEILPFLHVFTSDEFDSKFLESLTSPEEISGLFNKVVKLLPDLLERNEFTNQMSREDVKAIYEELSDTEGSFFNRFVHEVPGNFERKRELHEKYQTYCKKLNTTSLNLNKFGRYITNNITWLRNKSNCGTTKDGKRVAAWADTEFDSKAFEEWENSIVS